jgi:hypothetical protein
MGGAPLHFGPDLVQEGQIDAHERDDLLSVWAPWALHSNSADSRKTSLIDQSRRDLSRPPSTAKMRLPRNSTRLSPGTCCFVQRLVALSRARKRWIELRPSRAKMSKTQVGVSPIRRSGGNLSSVAPHGPGGKSAPSSGRKLQSGSPILKCPSRAISTALAGNPASTVARPRAGADSQRAGGPCRPRSIGRAHAWAAGPTRSRCAEARASGAWRMCAAPPRARDGAPRS